MKRKKEKRKKERKKKRNIKLLNSHADWRKERLSTSQKCSTHNLPLKSDGQRLK